MRSFVGLVRNHLGDAEELEDRYVTEPNGLNAELFHAVHLRDDRYCMYAVASAINREMQRLKQFPKKVIVSENLVRAWSVMGVPHDPSVIGWDIMTDPGTAARMLGRKTQELSSPPALTADEFVVTFRAFLRMDLPVSEVYKNIVKPDEKILKTPRATQSRAEMCRDVGLQVLRDRSQPAGGREDVQPILGSLETAYRILGDRFIYPSPSRGETPLPWGSQVPRLPDMEQTIKNAKMLDVRRAFCVQEQCRHGQDPRVLITRIGDQ